MRKDELKKIKHFIFQDEKYEPVAAILEGGRQVALVPSDVKRLYELGYLDFRKRPIHGLSSIQMYYES